MWYRILGLAFVTTLLLMAPIGAKAQPAFEDVASQMGLVDDQRCGNNIWYDFDNDGDLDLLRSARYTSDTYLYRNDGTSFTQLTGIGLPTSWDAGTLIPMDFDQDGDLDIAVAGYYTSHMLLVNDGSNHFSDGWEDLGLPPGMAGNRLLDWADFDRDGWMDLLIQTTSGWHLFRNEQGTHFSEITGNAQLPTDDGAGFAIADVDLDGDLDMFGTRLGSTGRYWKNSGSGVFTDATVQAGLSGIPASFCCAFADFNNDKYPDLITQDNGDQHGIWLNNGDGTFRHANVHGAACDFSQWPYGAWYAVADYDMDGHLDFYCCRPGGCSDNLAPNQLFHMDSISVDDIWFHDIAPELGMDYGPDGTATWSDFDGDGDLDLTLVSAYEPHIRLMRNNTINSANQFQVRPLGPNGEQDTWHCRVEIYNHGETAAIRGSELNYSNVGCNGLSTYFVLDPARHYDVKVFFPNGTVMGPDVYPQLSDVVPADINHRMIVRMGQNSSGTETPSAAPSQFSLAPAYPNPFNAVTSIRYTVPTAGLVKLAVYNLNGQHVRDLVNENVSAGEHRQSWDACGLSSGIYFLELRAANATAMQKLVLLK